MANQTSKDREDYLKTRRTYLQSRISQLQDSLRKAGLSSERKKSLQDKLKNFKDNLLKIKSTSNLKDIDMAKQSLSAQYKESVSKNVTSASPYKGGAGGGGSRASKGLGKGGATRRPGTGGAGRAKRTYTNPDIQELIKKARSGDEKAVESLLYGSSSWDVVDALNPNTSLENATHDMVENMGADQINWIVDPKTRKDSYNKKSDVDKNKKQLADVGLYLSGLENPKGADGFVRKLATKLANAGFEDPKTNAVLNDLKSENPSKTGSKADLGEKHYKDKIKYAVDNIAQYNSSMRYFKPTDPQYKKMLRERNALQRELTASRESLSELTQNKKAGAPAKKALTDKEGDKIVQDRIAKMQGNERKRNENSTPVKKTAPKLAREAFSTDEMIGKTKVKLKQLNDRLARAEKNGSSNVADIKKEIQSTTKFQKELTDRKAKRAEVKKATPKPKPNLKSDKSDKDTTVKVTRTNTKKPIGGRITSLKHNAKQLTLQTNISGKRMLRNAISDLYDSMTVAERKKFDITQYVSGQDLKAMSKSSDKIKDVVDNHKTEFLKPTEVKNNFAKDQKVIDAKNRKFKEEQKKNTQERIRQEREGEKSSKTAPAKDANGKRYTKRGVTQMLKQLREQNERGRKNSNAYKQREEDIKRLSKVLKTLSSSNPTLSMSDQHRLVAVANSLDIPLETIARASTVWGTASTYKELAKALNKIGIKGVTADGLEGDFDEGDGVNSGSAPLYEYFEKVLGDVDSSKLESGNGALVYATLYIADLIGEEELDTMIPDKSLRKLALKAKR